MEVEHQRTELDDAVEEAYYKPLFDDLQSVQRDYCDLVQFQKEWILIHNQNELNFYTEQYGKFHLIGMPLKQVFNQDCPQVFAYFYQSNLIVAAANRLIVYQIDQVVVDRENVQQINMDFETIKFKEIGLATYGLTDNMNLICITPGRISLAEVYAKKTGLLDLFSKKLSIRLQGQFTFTIMNDFLIVANACTTDTLDLLLYRIQDKLIFVDHQVIRFSSEQINQVIQSIEFDENHLYVICYADQFHTRQVALVKIHVEIDSDLFKKGMKQEIKIIKDFKNISEPKFKSKIIIKDGSYHIVYYTNGMNYYHSQNNQLEFPGRLIGFDVTNTIKLAVSGKIYTMNIIDESLLIKDKRIACNHLLYDRLIADFNRFKNGQVANKIQNKDLGPVINYITKEILNLKLNQHKDIKTQLVHKLETLYKWREFLKQHYAKQYQISTIEAIVYIQCLIYLQNPDYKALLEATMHESMCDSLTSFYQFLDKHKLFQWFPYQHLIEYALVMMRQIKFDSIQFWTSEPESLMALSKIKVSFQLFELIVQDYSPHQIEFLQPVIDSLMEQNQNRLLELLEVNNQIHLLIYIYQRHQKQGLREIIQVLNRKQEYIRYIKEVLDYDLLVVISKEDICTQLIQELKDNPKLQFYLQTLQGSTQVSQDQTFENRNLEYLKFLQSLC